MAEKSPKERARWTAKGWKRNGEGMIAPLPGERGLSAIVMWGYSTICRDQGTEEAINP
jgi:hypothetical protein